MKVTQKINLQQSHYFDITIIPNLEISQSILMSKVYQTLHYIFVRTDINTLQENQLAVSFPKYSSNSLGSIIRIIGNYDSLTEFHQNLCNVSNIRNYTLISKLTEIPQKILGYAFFYRQHHKDKSSIRRLAERKRAKQEELYIEDINYRYPEPYLQLQSSSTKQDKIRIYIGRRVVEKISIGYLSAYGINIKTGEHTTIPLF